MRWPLAPGAGNNKPQYMSHQDDLEWKTRGILIDWLIEVDPRFHLLPETLFLAINVVDRKVVISSPSVNCDSRRHRHIRDYSYGRDTSTTAKNYHDRVTGAATRLRPSGESRFGFVNYLTYESAAKAVEDLYGNDFHGQELYVGRARKKHEREEELRESYEAARLKKASKNIGVNLYIKNLNDDVDDEKVR
ncbi:hypothetical protein B0T17DRAFT_612799 [Bombardia bombarda]|uniref:RRM domain-containing protein n=1 Tax=Bombardia bombarda TaxID=252184 RepID=A0AA40CEN9_9PEZI|nr:hypothetical protein B0T17DRAFT_612799 [Bombardia bombarda]